MVSVRMRSRVAWMQVTIVATVLGTVACISSLIFLVIVMEARHDDFMAKVRQSLGVSKLLSVLMFGAA